LELTYVNQDLIYKELNSFKSKEIDNIPASLTSLFNNTQTQIVQQEYIIYNI